MSVFDQSFRKPSGCFGICNETGDRQAPIPASQNRQIEDHLETSSARQQKREIDDMLSQALKGLTFEEREEQMEILHGVDQKIAEEETFIDASLQELERHLSKIKSRSVYTTAEQMDPAYVRARAFRVMFLRANRYNAKESAENMLRFFEMKLQLFGDTKLVKDVTLGDLDEDDIAALKSGCLQLGGKDSSGRILLVNFPRLRGNVGLRSEMRMRYYIIMSALEKEENQLSGFIPIGYSVGDMKDRPGETGFFKNIKVAEVMPKYNAALHLCTDDSSHYLPSWTLKALKGVPLKMRSRFRLHFGSQTECLYRMSTFGIPHDFLPLDPNTNQICLKRHLEWVESRFAMEQGQSDRPLPTITPKEQSIICPVENDVLVGTGKRSDNVGNQRLRSLVKELSQAYGNGGTEARKELVDCVINSIQETGGRFLKEHHVDLWNVAWRKMPKGEMRIIVSQAFRNSLRRRKC